MTDKEHADQMGDESGAYRHLEDAGELARAGRPRLAAAAFDQAMRDCLPDLPLRFSLLLVRPDDDQVEEVAEAVYRQDEVTLRLAEGPRGVLAVYRGTIRLGDLSVRDDELVRGFGAEGLALYEPRILEILFREDGELQSVAVELVRPELRLCGGCGRTFTEHLPRCPHCGTSEAEAAVGRASLADALEDIVRLHGGQAPVGDGD